MRTSPVQWTGPGPEVLVRLDRESREPLGHQLQEALRQAIRTGRLRAGERVPSSRRLAEQLGVSRGLVVDCYDQLHAEGYLVGAVGSGTRVAEGVADGRLRAAVDTAAARPDAGHTPPVEVDFAYGIPDLASVPVPDWLWGLAEAGRTAPVSAMGDEADAGSLRLREVLTAYHRRVRAGCAEPGDAVVVGGFRQGLTMALTALAGHGIDVVALEDPGPREHDQIVRRAGSRPVAVPVDGQGVDVDRLRASGARAVLLTPAHQCPTGVGLGPERRHELLAWAAAVDAVILEDDYDAEFRYDRQPIGSLQGLAPDRVLALGSVSKTLAPGIRVGWLLVPPRYLPAVLQEKHLTSRGVPALDQWALAHLMESGGYDRHLRRMRDLYRTRRDVLVAALGERLPDLRLTGLEAGCHALLGLPAGVDEVAVTVAARQRGVDVRGLGDYRLPPDLRDPQQALTGADPFGSALVLGFGNVNESRIRQGVGVLADVIRQGGPRPGSSPSVTARSGRPG